MKVSNTILLAGLATATPVRRSLDTNKFLGAITKLLPVNKPITDICGAITKGEEMVADVFKIATSADDTSCSDVKLIFTRGTCDPGNIGALVAPPFIDALQGALGGKSFTTQGVEYPASVQGYLDADHAAGHTMAGMVRDTLSKCPDTKIVMGGYSQGGFSVHYAADELGDDMSKVSSAVIFGDPLSHKAVSNIDGSKVKIICHDDDDICNTGALILPAHLTYAIDAPDAAQFVISNL